MTDLRVCSLVTLLVLTACGGGPPPAQPQPQPLSIEERIFYDENAGIRDSAAFEIRDRAMLESTWKKIVETRRTPPSLADVPALAALDFERNMLLVVAGGRLVRGDRVRIEGAGRAREVDMQGKEREVLLVRYNIIEGCGTLPDAAYPLEIVRIPRYTGTVRYQGTRTRGPNCG